MVMTALQSLKMSRQLCHAVANHRSIDFAAVGPQVPLAHVSVPDNPGIALVVSGTSQSVVTIACFPHPDAAQIGLPPQVCGWRGRWQAEARDQLSAAGNRSRRCARGGRPVQPIC